MQRLFFGVVVTLSLAGVAGAQQPGKEPDRKPTLQVGDPAPAFALSDVAGKKTVSLAELKGKPVVLYFGSCT
jgi:cytochrome oxidase Cu insertion factor (SCO1/SenC/PrrC family)